MYSFEDYYQPIMLSNLTVLKQKVW